MPTNPKNILILGIGETGIALGKFLVSKNIKIAYSEQRQKEQIPTHYYQQAQKLTNKIFTGEHNYQNLIQYTTIALSPGAPHNIPVLQQIKQKTNIPILSEIELPYPYHQGKIIAVTGTKGKTSTIRFIQKLMQNAQLKYDIGGHIQKPFSTCNPKAKHILSELACYQIEGIQKFTPYIFAITNISPDHQERYPNYQDYFNLKIALAKQQNNTQYTIIPTKLIPTAKKNNFQGKIYLFTNTNQPIHRGTNFLPKQQIITYHNNNTKHQYQLKKCQIKGNITNIMIMINTAEILNIPPHTIQKTINNITQLPHRNQTIYHNNKTKITIIDDTASNTITSIQYALQNNQNKKIILTMNPNTKQLLDQKDSLILLENNTNYPQKIKTTIKNIIAKTNTQPTTIIFSPGVPHNNKNQIDKNLKLFSQIITNNTGE